jgi:CTP:molybdopterin cytidylyltransferase MocA
MGRVKQLVSWPSPAGEVPLVAAAYDAIAGACREIVVVLGHEPDAVAAALAPRPYRPVFSNPDADLFDSIRAGLIEAHSRDATACVLVQPGDHPEVKKQTLAAILAARLQTPQLAILPEFNERGGHPALLPPCLIQRLLEESCPAGLGQFWRENPELCRRLPVDDPGVVRDVDVPADLPS